METNQTTETPLPSVRMFYGDNGIHEFWEDEKHESCVIRNHGENWWLCVRLAGRNAPPDTARMKRNKRQGSRFQTTYVLSAKTAPSLFKRIEKQYQVRLYPDNNHHWLRSRKAAEMVLRPSEQKSL